MIAGAVWITREASSAGFEVIVGGACAGTMTPLLVVPLAMSVMSIVGWDTFEGWCCCIVVRNGAGKCTGGK